MPQGDKDNNIIQNWLQKLLKVNFVCGNFTCDATIITQINTDSKKAF